MYMDTNGYMSYISLAKQFREDYNLGKTAQGMLHFLAERGSINNVRMTGILNEEAKIGIARENVYKQFERLKSMGLVERLNAKPGHPRPYFLSDLGWFYTFHKKTVWPGSIMSNPTLKSNRFFKDLVYPYFQPETIEALKDSFGFGIILFKYLQNCCVSFVESVQKMPIRRKWEMQRLGVKKLDAEQSERLLKEEIEDLDRVIRAHANQYIVDVIRRLALLEKGKMIFDMKTKLTLLYEEESQQWSVLLKDKQFNNAASKIIEALQEDIDTYIDVRGRSVLTP